MICATPLKTEGGNGGESQFMHFTLGFDCVKLSQVLSLAILFKKRAPSSNKLKKDHTVYEGIFNQKGACDRNNTPENCT